MVLSVSGTTKMSPSRKRLGMSDSRLHTHSRAETVCPVTPSPVSSTWPTTWTFIMLVVPEMPRGTPAVMTTKSPLSTRPVFSAGVHGPLKEGVGVTHLVHQGGHHAPGEVQLAPHVLLGGAAHNGVQGPELGELPGPSRRTWSR